MVKCLSNWWGTTLGAPTFLHLGFHLACLAPAGWEDGAAPSPVGGGGRRRRGPIAPNSNRCWSLFQSGRSRREEALIDVELEPPHVGSYGIGKATRMSQNHSVTVKSNHSNHLRLVTAPLAIRNPPPTRDGGATRRGEPPCDSEWFRIADFRPPSPAVLRPPRFANVP